MGLGLERRKNRVHEEGVSEAGEVVAKAEMNWGVCVRTHSCTAVCVSASAHVCVFMYVCTHIREESMEVCCGVDTDGTRGLGGH